MAARLDSELLRTFLAIADTGSLTRAGAIVGRTQSALSMQLRQLEQSIGRELFTRGPRGMTLTHAGETLLTPAHRVVVLLDDTARAFRGERLDGQVRVGVPEEYGSSILPVVLAHFAREHPDVEVTLGHGPSAGFPDALARDELDLAVIVADRGGVPGEALVVEPTLWVSSARHLPHEREPVPLALFEPGCWWRDQALAMLDARGVRWRVVCTSASVAGIAGAVASGIAVAVMGRSTFPPGASVLTAADGFPPLPASNVILRLRSSTPTTAVQGMADTIRVAIASPAT